MKKIKRVSKELQIKYYKSKMKKYYLDYKDKVDSYECGLEFADFVSAGEITRLKNKVNSISDKLNELGSKAPKIK